MLSEYNIENNCFDYLVKQLRTNVSLLPDKRIGKNSSYTISDAALSAFSVFFTQSPSFLYYQTQMQENKGKNNATSLFGVKNIPSDNQIRNLLDAIEPINIVSTFDDIFGYLKTSGHINKYRFINDTILIAVDGINYFSSNKIHCKNCSTHKHKNGEINYLHSAITPIIVAPGEKNVISLFPEFIIPQDGHDKQDSEHAAIKRWLKNHGYKYKDIGVTILGDDLYSNQPICAAILEQGFNFILTCKVDSHKTIYGNTKGLSKIDVLNEIVVKRKVGKNTYTDLYRFVNKIPIKDGDNAILVNWCEIISTNQDGKKIYSNSYITSHTITKDNVIEIVQAGRTRWKIENENNNTLKNHGYHLKHNFGHGKKYLSQFLFTLNLLAFLFHTTVNIHDLKYKILRDKLPTRQAFFDDIRALTRYIYFESWDSMMCFMLKGLELEIPDTG